MQTTRIASLVFALSTTAVAQVSLSLSVGAEHKVSLAGLSRVAVGDPDVLDVRTQGKDELILKGASPGTTQVLAWTTGHPKPQVFSVTVTVPTTPTFSATLKVGQKTSRAAPSLLRLAVGDPGVLEVLPAEGGLTLIGRAQGSTTVVLRFPGGRVETWLVTVVE